MGFVEIAVAKIPDFISDEDGFGFFLAKLLSCAALAIMITYLLSINGVI